MSSKLSENISAAFKECNELRKEVALLKAETLRAVNAHLEVFDLYGEQQKLAMQLNAENKALRKDAERLNWLDNRSMPVVEGQCWSQPEGELWGYSWTVAGQCSTVREAIDYAMCKELPNG